MADLDVLDASGMRVCRVIAACSNVMMIDQTRVNVVSFDVQISCQTRVRAPKVDVEAAEIARVSIGSLDPEIACQTRVSCTKLGPVAALITATGSIHRCFMFRMFQTRLAHQLAMSSTTSAASAPMHHFLGDQSWPGNSRNT
jgi:hypothetical protein